MRILVRISKLALWSRRLAMFAAAMLIVAIVLHFFEQVTIDAFEISIAIGTGVAALAVLLALIAYGRLWISGDRGWGPASFGLFVGLLCLVPAAGALALALIYPSTSDVTTALVSPPDLVSADPGHSDIDPETVLERFPNLITRIYQIAPETLYPMTETLMRREGWDIVRNRPPSGGGEGLLNATRRSFFGWDKEMAVRITPGPLGSVIDLRAASLRTLPHDLGENGRAIEAFLLKLDEAVTAYQQASLAAGEDMPAVEGLDDQP